MDRYGEAMRNHIDLDDIDRQLVGLLIRNGRAPYSALAPDVGLSQAAVRARVRRLLDDHVVTVSARVDPRSIGFAVFSFVFVTVAGSAREVAERVAELPEAVFVVCITGHSGLMIEIRCRDDQHHVAVMDQLRATQGVVGTESLIAFGYRKAGTSGVAAELFGQSFEPRVPKRAPRDRPLDEIDVNLIRELMVDGRATYADLAPRVGLSQAGVRARVQRLLDESIVVIHATSTARALGLGAFSAVRISVRGSIGPIADKLSAMPEFTVVALTSGSFDLAGEVWCRDNAHLLDILDAIRSMDGVASVVSNTYLAIEKEAYRLS
jgi:DNA-binding Lrp family transcriptional regulator